MHRRSDVELKEMDLSYCTNQKLPQAVLFDHICAFDMHPVTRDKGLWLNSAGC
jgi:hypothetical protein